MNSKLGTNNPGKLAFGELGGLGSTSEISQAIMIKFDLIAKLVDAPLDPESCAGAGGAPLDV